MTKFTSEQLALIDQMTPCGACVPCALNDFCENACAPLVADGQLDNPEWLRDARNYCASLGHTKSLWVSEIFDLNLRRPVRINRKGKSGAWVDYHLPIENLFIFSDEVIEAGRVDQYMDAQRDWFDSFLCTPVPDFVTPYVTRARREHARIVLTLVGCNNPEAFVTWGVRPVTSDGEA